MPNLNQVTIIGHLGRDPEVRYLPSGEAACNFSVAVTENWKAKDGEKKEHTEWFRVAFFGKLAEVCGEYLKKGSAVYVQGRQRTREYEKDGVTKQSVELIGQNEDAPRQVALFPEEHAPEEVGAGEFPVVRLRLGQMTLRRPRQWGACWLGCEWWEQLGLGDFWREKLPPSREGTRWEKVLQTLVLYRLIDPGSEWRLHRHWFDHTAIADLLGGDFSLAEIHRLYQCHDKLVAHKAALFDHLTARWRDLFDAKYEVLLYDLTSTYFEGAAEEIPKATYGYSRDHRGDCKQVVLALVVTPEGLPLAYEVMPGNTQDKQTLKDFLARLEALHGRRFEKQP